MMLTISFNFCKNNVCAICVCSTLKYSFTKFLLKKKSYISEEIDEMLICVTLFANDQFLHCVHGSLVKLEHIIIFLIL